MALPPSSSPSPPPSPSRSPCPPMAGSAKTDPEATIWLLEYLLLQPFTTSVFLRYLECLGPIPSPPPTHIFRLYILRCLAIHLRSGLTLNTLSCLDLIHLLGAAAPALFIPVYTAVAIHVASLSRSDASQVASRLSRGPFTGDPKIKAVAELARAIAGGDEVAMEIAFAGDTNQKAMLRLGDMLDEEYLAVETPILEKIGSFMRDEKVKEFFANDAKKEIMETLRIIGLADGENQVPADMDLQIDLSKKTAFLTKRKSPETPAKKAAEALRISSSNLHPFHQEPPPDALRVAEVVGKRQLPARLSKSVTADVRPPVVLQQSSASVPPTDGDARDTRRIRRSHRVECDAQQKDKEKQVPAAMDLQEEREAMDIEMDICKHTRLRKRKSLASPEVNKAVEALRASSSNLHSVVQDPLPDALRIAEEVGIRTTPARLSVTFTAVVVQPPERDDPDVSGSGNSESEHRRPMLPSPERHAVSPLQITDDRPRKVRRRNVKWTQVEVETLRRGVQEHGRGRWKTILESYPDVFVSRTEVDLKDKWRNIDR